MLKDAAIKRTPPGRLPTTRQWRFATLCATGTLSLCDCFRAVYPARSGERSAQTLCTAASRMRRNPRVRWAIERILAEAGGTARIERLQTHERARFADHVLRECARRAGHRSPRQAAWEAELQQRRDAWRMFRQAAAWVVKRRPLLPAELAKPILDTYAPLFPNGNTGAGSTPAKTSSATVVETEAHATEIATYVQHETVVRARAGPTTELKSEFEWGPLPGHFPIRMGWLRRRGKQQETS